MDAWGQQLPKKRGICWCGGQCGRCGWSDTRWPIVGGCGKTGIALRGGPRAAELVLAARVERRSDATEPAGGGIGGHVTAKAWVRRFDTACVLLSSSLSTVSGVQVPQSAGQEQKKPPRRVVLLLANYRPNLAGRCYVSLG